MVRRLRTSQMQEVKYAESCLPITMHVAEKASRILLKQLRNFPKTWAYEDKILVILLPNLVADVKKFYDGAGPRMDEMFQLHQLKHFDDVLSLNLAKLIESLTNK